MHKIYLSILLIGLCFLFSCSSESKKDTGKRNYDFEEYTAVNIYSLEKTTKEKYIVYNKLDEFKQEGYVNTDNWISQPVTDEEFDRTDIPKLDEKMLFYHFKSYERINLTSDDKIYLINNPTTKSQAHRWELNNCKYIKGYDDFSIGSLNGYTVLDVNFWRFYGSIASRWYFIPTASIVSTYNENFYDTLVFYTEAYEEDAENDILTKYVLTCSFKFKYNAFERTNHSQKEYADSSFNDNSLY